VGMLLGRDIEALSPKETARIGVPLLELVAFSVPPTIDAARRVVDGVSLEVRAGEVVGLFGLIGAGRTELAMALFGAWPLPPQGTVRVHGQIVSFASPEEAIEAGVAPLPADRER